jgi:hypothetical protein
MSMIMGGNRSYALDYTKDRAAVPILGAVRNRLMMLLIHGPTQASQGLARSGAERTCGGLVITKRPQMFFMFSNALGWTVSIAISVAVTLLLLKSCS